jgi:pyruvate-formate lyase-activating enzyme
MSKPHPNPPRRRAVDRLVRRATGLWKRRGLRMSIELTNRCNFRCTYCPHSARGQDTADDLNTFDRTLGFMSQETFDRCLANARKYADSVSFGFFGEQMLHPRFAELIRSIPTDRPYRLVINTNGSVLTDENIEALKRFDLMRFSLDSTDSESFDRLRPGGAILTVNGQRSSDRYSALTEQIERWLSLPGHPHTQLVYVTTEANKDDRQRYLDYWLPRMGPEDCVVMKSVLSYGGVMKDPYMTANPCTIPQDNRINVAWNGDCTPCNLDVNLALRIGNILATGDLRAMIRSWRYKAVMHAVRRREGICGACRDANNHAESMLYWGERGTEGTGTTRLLAREEVLAKKGLGPPHDLRKAA